MYKIFRTRKVKAIPCIWNGISQTSLKSKKIHGSILFRQWNLYTKDGYYTGIDDQQEWDKTSNFIRNRLLTDKKYLKSIYTKQHILGKHLTQFSKSFIKSNTGNKSLAKLLKDYQAIQENWLAFDNINVPPWLFAGDELQTELQNKARGFGVSESEFTILCTSPLPSFSAEEELAIAKIAFIVKKNKKITNIFKALPTNGQLAIPKSILRRIQALVNKYYWIPFGYDGPTTYTTQHYIHTVSQYLTKTNDELKRKIKELEQYPEKIRKKHQTLAIKYKLPKQFLNQVKILHTLSLMTDERKEFTFPAHIAFEKIITAISNRLGLPNDTFKYVTWEELQKNFKSPKNLKKYIRDAKR